VSYQEDAKLFDTSMSSLVHTLDQVIKHINSTTRQQQPTRNKSPPPNSNAGEGQMSLIDKLEKTIMEKKIK
jgi:hypothetical protein